MTLRFQSAQPIDLIGGRLELLARMGADEMDTVLFRGSMDGGKLVPLHSHIDPECFVVLTGRIEVFLPEESMEWRSVEAGESVLIAEGAKHSVRNSATDRAELMVMTNNRLANYFLEAGRPAAPGSVLQPPTPDDIARFIEISKKYGYWLAPPPKDASAG